MSTTGTLENEQREVKTPERWMVFELGETNSFGTWGTVMKSPPLVVNENKQLKTGREKFKNAEVGMHHRHLVIVLSMLGRLGGDL